MSADLDRNKYRYMGKIIQILSNKIYKIVIPIMIRLLQATGFLQC